MRLISPVLSLLKINMSWLEYSIPYMSYCEFEVQFIEVFLEELNNTLAIENIDPFGCMSRNIYHLMKWRMFEGLKRLYFEVRYWNERSKRFNWPDLSQWAIQSQPLGKGGLNMEQISPCVVLQDRGQAKTAFWAIFDSQNIFPWSDYLGKLWLEIVLSTPRTCLVRRRDRTLHARVMVIGTVCLRTWCLC